MPDETDLKTPEPDPAAVFGCALSLWKALQAHAEADSGMDLSEYFNGMDELKRHVMRIGREFEAWACVHVAFEELDQTWPYLLADNFGVACVKIALSDGVANFDENDCLRVALHLRLPIKHAQELRLPIDVRAANPVAGGFREFRIQTVRNSREDDDIAAFWFGDDPFDEDFDPPYFGIYGVEADGTSEHIADRNTYIDALEFLRKLVPGIDLPNQPIVGGQ